MGQGPPRFVAQDVRKLLEADLDVLGGFVIVGEIGRVPPSLLLSRGQDKKSPPPPGHRLVGTVENTYQKLTIFLLEAMKPPRRIPGEVLAGAPRRQGSVG